jgi:hypothetical protein
MRHWLERNAEVRASWRKQYILLGSHSLESGKFHL